MKSIVIWCNLIKVLVKQTPGWTFQVINMSYWVCNYQCYRSTKNPVADLHGQNHQMYDVWVIIKIQEYLQDSSLWSSVLHNHAQLEHTKWKSAEILKNMIKLYSLVYILVLYEDDAWIIECPFKCNMWHNVKGTFNDSAIFFSWHQLSRYSF